MKPDNSAGCHYALPPVTISRTTRPGLFPFNGPQGVPESLIDNDNKSGTSKYSRYPSAKNANSFMVPSRLLNFAAMNRHAYRMNSTWVRLWPSEVAVDKARSCRSALKRHVRCPFGHLCSGSLRCPMRHADQYSSHSHNVARRHGQFEVLVYALDAAVHRLPDVANGLAPAEVFLDALAHYLAGSVGGVARC